MKSKETLIQESISRLQTLADVFILRREQLARSIGLTPAQWRVLEEISGEEFMPSLFARQQSSSAAAVSKILRQLEGKGLIEVDVTLSPDARQKRFRLTKSGRVSMNKLQRSRAEAVDEIWRGLDAASLHQFSETSREIAARMEVVARRQVDAEIGANNSAGVPKKSQVSSNKRNITGTSER